MPKVKNSKHRVEVTLPDGFELVDGKLVKKGHGGHVTGDQYEYGLTTFNPHASESMGPKDTDVKYSLSSVPRDIANIEAEGGETVLTDLSNDGQFGLYDIVGPRHSSGGVPMLLPEQSFIFSDTQAMKMGKDMLAEHGIQSRKKMTPAKISKQYDLNKYYGILNDEYADKIQANTADLMLQKNKEGLSKLAFQSEMMKGFEEGVPLAAYPYLQSIGMDPFEFAQKMEGMQQGPGDQQAQPMNEADAQAMSAMAAYGRELNEAQFGYGNIGGMGMNNYRNFNQAFGEDMVRPNIRSAYMPMNLNMKGNAIGAFNNLVEGAGRLFSKQDTDGDGLADGAFKDLKAKTNRYRDTHKFLKGKTTKGMENMGDKAMLKYNPETMGYDVQYNDPRYQSNVKTGNIFTKKNKRKLMHAPDLEGYKSFNEMQKEMSGLSDDQKDQMRYMGESLTDFQNEKANMPKGMQFGMDASGGIGYYDAGATLPEGSQERINEMMMTGSYNKRLGGGLRKAQFGNFDFTQLPPELAKYFPNQPQQDFGPMGPTPYQQKMMNQAEQIKNDPASFFQNFNPQTFGQTDDYANVQSLGPDLKLQQDVKNRSEVTPEDPDQRNAGEKLAGGINRMMNSPLMNAFGEGSVFATKGADFINEMAKNRKRRRAENDLQRMTMADNQFGISEPGMLSQGTYDENTGDVFSIMQGVSPFGGNASYYGKHGFEIPRADDGQETKSWKIGDELTGGTDSWVDWYMSDENEKGRKKRYETYVFLKEAQAKKQGKTFDKSKLPSEEDFHDTYVRAQRQINAIQDFYKDDPDYLKRSDWDSGYEFDPKYANSKKAGEDNRTWRGTNFRYKGAIAAINKKIKEDNPDLEDEELNKLLFKELDDAGIRVFQTAYQAGQIMNVADNDEFLKFVQSGIDDDTFTWNGVTYTISPEDAAFGNTTVGQREQTTVPIYPCKPCPDGPDKGKVPERDENGNCPCGDCPDCPEGKVPGLPTESEPCPCKDARKIEDPDDPEMAAPPEMTPWIQDLIKTEAIANRERDMLFPWEPAVRRSNLEVMLEDPNRAINAANAQYAAAAQALGAFGGKNQLAANLSGMAGQAADNVANIISGVNARNVASVNRANEVNQNIEMQLNQLEDASKVRQYDNTQKVLQTYMDEKNFDREQYADAIANTITNMANTYNVNQMYDYFNIDPLRGGTVGQVGSKAFQPTPEQDEWAFMDDWMEATKRAKTLGLTKTNKDGTTSVDPAVVQGILQAKSGQRNYADPREEAWRQQYRNYMAGAQTRKTGGQPKMKKWASPFYTGKMGV
jgi:hypothetical protein